ncbi:MAG TPA: methyltransferase domain-containing protein [Galbitalea sp.]|jgi:SAM-dependent methyltransferase|nr:methyltransferase domain-containing protein [Galbitalea sp.]
MTDIRTSAQSDDAVKARHRAMWASGDYATLASDIIWPLGPRVVEAAEIHPGERVLDIAAGSGNVAIPAALRGASVVASDLTPELLDRGRRLAVEAGAQLEWRVADAENLPFDDHSFDVVTSCVGVMFAPHHQQTADELLRVTRHGGRIALLNWTPSGFIGSMFSALASFNAPLPFGASPAPLWGDVDHVRQLLDDRVVDFSYERETLRVDRFAAPHSFRRYFAKNYGPTIAVYNRNADDIIQIAKLDAALDELAGTWASFDGSLEWEYLLVTATVR